MAVVKLYLVQRTGRHVIKRLTSTVAPAVYDGVEFGIWGVPGYSVSTLNFPFGVARDISGSIYVCDARNRRIVKLDASLNYLDSYDTSATVGTPYAISYDANGDLYIVGIELVYGTAIRVERITTTLTSVLASGNLGSIRDVRYWPSTICRGFDPDSFLVGGASVNLFQTVESVSFSSFTTKTIYGESTVDPPEIFDNTHYNGVVHHSDGNLYLNNGRKIIKASSSFINVGDSDTISKTICGLRQGIGGTLLLYNADSQKVMRFDTDLNFVEDVYVDSDSVIATDAYDVMDFIEI